METASDIINSIGWDRVRARIGIDDPTIKFHLRNGKLPASWYAALCDLHGADLPRSLFTFKGLAA